MNIFSELFKIEKAVRATGVDRSNQLLTLACDTTHNRTAHTCMRCACMCYPCRCYAHNYTTTTNKRVARVTTPACERDLLYNCMILELRSMSAIINKLHFTQH